MAVHELSHYFVHRLLGRGNISLVSITPAENYEGICLGARRAAFVKEGVVGVDAADIRAILQPMMPQVGEDRTSQADVFQNALDSCVELMAGEVGERNVFDEPCSLPTAASGN